MKRSKIEWTDATTVTHEDMLILAYMAGIIDSDGCITIHRSTRRGVIYYAARISIAGTRREPHDLASKLWGGTVSVHYPRNQRYCPQYQWSRTGQPAVRPIVSVLPFLRVKVRQAYLALNLQEHVDYGRLENPFPWFGPDYDPRIYRAELRDEIVAVMAGKAKTGRLLQGRTWDEMPLIESREA